MGPVQNAAPYKKVQTSFDNLTKEREKVAHNTNTKDKSKEGASNFFFNLTLIENLPEN